jgi:hypothetical protein
VGLGSVVWGRATVIDSKDSGKPQKAALNGAYNRFFDPEMSLLRTLSKKVPILKTSKDIREL